MKYKRLAKFIEENPERVVEIGERFHKKAMIPKKRKRVQYLAWIGALLFSVSSEGLFKLLTNTQGEHFATFEDFLTDFCNKNSICRSQATELKTIQSLYFTLKGQGHRPESIDLLVTLHRISDNDNHALRIYKAEADLLARNPKKGPHNKVTAALLKLKYKKDDSTESAALAATTAAPSVTGTVAPVPTLPTPIQSGSTPSQRDKDIALRLKKAVEDKNWSGVTECIQLLDPAIEIPPITQPEIAATPLPEDTVKQPEGHSAAEVSSDSTETKTPKDGSPKTIENGSDAKLPEDGTAMVATDSGTMDPPAPTDGPASDCQLEKSPCQSACLSDWQLCEVVNFRPGVEVMIYTSTTPKPLVRVEVHRPHAHPDARELISALILSDLLFDITSVEGSANLSVLTGRADSLELVKRKIERLRTGPNPNFHNFGM